MRTVAVVSIAMGALLATVGVIGMLTSDDDGAPSVSIASTTTAGAPASVTSTTGVTSEAAVRMFVPQLVEAIRTQDTTFKFARLHPLVIERYGEATCRAGLDQPQPDFVMDVVSVGAAESWDWMTDGLTTRVPDTIPVAVRRSGPEGALVDGVIHLAEVEGEIRWFTDCGTPSSS